jgi:hypothetical protein
MWKQFDLAEHSRINILQWILTNLGTYLDLKRIWKPIDFQGQRSRSQSLIFRRGDKPRFALPLLYNETWRKAHRLIQWVHWNLSKSNLIGTKFCVRFIQVKLTKIFYIGTIMFILYRILVYSGLSLVSLYLYIYTSHCKSLLI